jgi:hypothetical protein
LWQGCLKEIKDEHKAIAPGTAEAHIADKVLLRVIGIVEHALASRMQPC